MTERLLPPWDQMSYFLSPVEVTLTGTGSPQLAAPADPNRVLLLIANCGAAAPIYASIHPGVAFAQGIQINASAPPLLINWSWWGSLVNQSWYVAAPLGVTYTIQSLSLKEWPSPQEGSLNA